MKKIFKFLPIIFLILLLLVSCKAALDVPTLGNKPRKLAPGHVLVQIGFNEFPTYRTVYPDEWVEDDDYVDGQNQKRSSLTYTLHKGTIDGAILGTSDLSWGDIKKGYFIDLPDGSNTVFLVAKKGDKIALVASSTITVPGPDMLTFILRPYRDDNTQASDTNTARGNIDLTVAFLDPIKTGRKNVDKIVATLSVAPPINIGEVPSGTETMEFTATTTNKIIQGYKSTNGETNMSSVRYKCPNVQAGVYKLKLELYINAAKWGTTEQTIIVDPGNTSHKTIEIPYKLDEKPPKPTDLQVKYARPDNDEDTTQEYTATFTWKDNSFNAEGFELLITDATGTSVNPQPSITYDTTGKPRATVKLKLATEYKAKIKAKNATFGDSDFTDFLDTNTGDIIHLARIKYDLGESGQVVDVPDDENPLCVKSTGTTGATPAHNLAVGYYTKLITGTNVQLPRDIGFPSVYRIANNFVYTIKGWYGTNIDSSGAPGSTTIGTATASVKELPEGITDSISLTAVWEQHTPTGISFPQNKELCYIVDGNSWIDAKKDTAKPITVKIIPKTGYSIKTPADDITGTCSTDTAATIETGAITTPGGVIIVPCNVTFKASGYHCVNFFITLTDDSGHKTYVSALAYFDVK